MQKAPLAHGLDLSTGHSSQPLLYSVPGTVWAQGHGLDLTGLVWRCSVFSLCSLEHTLIMNGSPKCCPCSRMFRKYCAKLSSFATRLLQVFNMATDIGRFQELNTVRETHEVASIWVQSLFASGTRCAVGVPQNTLWENPLLFLNRKMKSFVKPPPLPPQVLNWKISLRSPPSRVLVSLPKARQCFRITSPL